MAQVSGREWLSGLRSTLRLSRSRLALLNERDVMSGGMGAGSFTWPVLIFFLGAVFVTAVQLWLGIAAEHQSPFLPEVVYVVGIAVAVSARGSRHIWGIIVFALLAIALCILLDAMTRSDWGNIGLYVIIATVVYRLSPQLSLPIFAICAVVILAAEGLFNLLLGTGHVNGGNIVSQALIIGFAFAASLSQRMRHLLINRLEHTEAQLREEMSRVAELAAAHERARIARDIHDVLAHSLTVLSVQVQALRQLVRDNPERAAAMLEQMADVLRESQAESRQVVGLLREAITDEDNADVAALLRVTADRFTERTGIRCTLREHGSPCHPSARHIEALRFGLQEALTNAYRHGWARRAEADVWWEPESVRLSVCDDGVGVASAPSGAGSGNGLRGMRERAEALGGRVEAGPQAHDAGYAISLTLPLATEHETAAAPDTDSPTATTMDAGKTGGSSA